MYGVFTDIWLRFFIVNVGKYTDPMDAMGQETIVFFGSFP